MSLKDLIKPTIKPTASILAVLALAGCDKKDSFANIPKNNQSALIEKYGFAKSEEFTRDLCNAAVKNNEDGTVTLEIGLGTYNQHIDLNEILEKTEAYKHIFKELSGSSEEISFKGSDVHTPLHMQSMFVTGSIDLTCSKEAYNKFLSTMQGKTK